MLVLTSSSSLLSPLPPPTPPQSSTRSSLTSMDPQLRHLRRLLHPLQPTPSPMLLRRSSHHRLPRLITASLSTSPRRPPRLGCPLSRHCLHLPCRRRRRSLHQAAGLPPRLRRHLRRYTRRSACARTKSPVFQRAPFSSCAGYRCCDVICLPTSCRRDSLQGPPSAVMWTSKRPGVAVKSKRILLY